jgi:hypothetical protein
MRSICILLGSNTGSNPAYLLETQKIAELIVTNNINLIYGGGKLGLMGVLADTVLQYGGNVTGIITQELYDRSEAHLQLTHLEIVESMQQRKHMMMNMADGFIALPGGLGTLEELFEIWNASKLRLHNKPIGLLNVKKYYNKLIQFINYSSKNNFLTEGQKKMIHIHKNSETLLKLLQNHDRKNKMS